MGLQLLIADINTNKVLLAEKNNLDLEDKGIIYEHLRYYCTKFSPLPSILVHISENSILAIDKMVYLRIAKDLCLSTIRAVIDESSNKNAVNKLAETEEIKILDYAQLRIEEKSIDYAWHIFFFERQLNLSEIEKFEQLIFEQFNSQSYMVEKEKNSAISHFCISHSGKCIEVKGLTPFENYEWGNAFRQKLIDFHINVANIDSYQGHQWVVK